MQTLRLDRPVVWLAAGGIGLLATALLLANNLRDIAGDAVAGKRTLAVRIGRRRAGHLYTLCVVLPLAGVAVWGVVSVTGAVAASRPWAAFLPLAAAAAAVAPVRIVEGDAEGRALLPVLAATARLQMVFGALVALALWLWIP